MDLDDYIEEIANIEKSAKRVYYKISNVSKRYLDYSDLVQAGMMALVEIDAKSLLTGRKVTTAYAGIVTYWAMWDEVRRCTPLTRTQLKGKTIYMVCEYEDTTPSVTPIDEDNLDLYKCVSRLPLMQQQIVVPYLLGESKTDIARHLNITQAAVSHRYALALKKLSPKDESV